MPTQIQLEQSLGGQRPSTVTGNLAKQLIDEERRGRLTRESQVQENCRVDVWIKADFSGGEGSGLLTDFIEFAHVHFTQKPSFSSGSERLAQEGEKPLAPDASNFDESEHLTVPGLAMVAAWRRDERGFYSGARLYLFALAAVPEGYRVNISATFLGPAVRMGDE
ncbi:MAG: hypothetical protein JXA87_07820 [Thermoleophilia bacterium]|nr:hypothetical protein [Thermoleophilia bacterium]